MRYMPPTNARDANRPSLFTMIAEDWRANRGTPPIQVALALFRLSQYLRERLGRRNPIAAIVAITYRFYSEMLVGFELPVSTHVGRRLTVWHGFGLVVHSDVILGDDVQLRQGVTIGNTRADGLCPRLQDNVSVGAGATILGGIVIGANASIGAHALVLEDVGPGGRVRAPVSSVDNPTSANHTG